MNFRHPTPMDFFRPSIENLVCHRNITEHPCFFVYVTYDWRPLQPGANWKPGGCVYVEEQKDGMKKGRSTRECFDTNAGLTARLLALQHLKCTNTLTVPILDDKGDYVVNERGIPTCNLEQHVPKLYWPETTIWSRLKLPMPQNTYQDIGID